ncbi:MAG: molecular chaperone TorD family protein [SAR324 cluster bacterium]|nr:molecular chaperone TorD family protein [SAR324 cluster bacterium]
MVANNMLQELCIIAELLEGRIPENFDSSPLIESWNQRYQEFDDPRDEFGADHYQALGLEVSPYASVYFDELGQMGGDAFEHVNDAYRAGHWYPKGTPDHIATEISYLIVLLKEGRKAEAGQFLSSQVLTWLPIFAIALKQTENFFFSHLANHLLDVSQKLYKELNPGLFPPELPKLEQEILENPETGLKDIAKYLLTPGLCGFYLTQFRLKKLANQLEVPFGFGTRSQILPSLIFSSIDYSKAIPLLSGLQEVTKEWSDELKAIKLPSCQTWLDQVEITRGLLAKMQAQVE